MHPEHAEHRRRNLNRTIYLDSRLMRETTIIIRVGRVLRWRLKAALILMKLAGRLGGFDSVMLARETHESR